MKILLVSANGLAAPYPVYPLGLDYVAAAVGPGHEVKVADVHLLPEPAALTESIRAFGPDLVGLSLRNIDNTDLSAPEGFVGRYQALASVIREATAAPLVLGGSGFTLFPREMMSAMGADYGIVGEGERFGLLVSALARGEKTPAFPGLIAAEVRPESGDAVSGPWKGGFGRRFDRNAPHVAFYLAKGGMLNLQTRRGCPFQCIYCTYPHIEGRRSRFTAPEAAARTAMDLQEAGARYLFITDSAFNADYAHSAAVGRAFERLGLSIPWGAFFAPTRPPADYYLRLADAGLRHVEFGTESLSDPVLFAYGKPFRTADVLESHQAARAAGVHAAHYFLLGGPGETRETLTRTLSNIDKLEKTVLFFFCGMRIYPHTRLYDMAIGEGQISEGTPLLEPVFYRSRDMDEREIVEKVEERRAGRSNWLIGAGGSEVASTLDRMYARGYSGPLWEYLIR
ncbi:lipid biosynthesis B12-binding/radical SAM protein [Desulfococcus sp.]|uniref:lipid biosynthesis B12-binding/radical SAM protein n=1 Tax=Desulfococcus sp. TaxID=2025834 RepID=UPI003593D29C